MSDEGTTAGIPGARTAGAAGTPGAPAGRRRWYLFWIAKWVIGSATGSFGTLALVGISVVSAMTARSAADASLTARSFLPGARLASGILWLAGPTNTLLAIAAEGFARAVSRSRPLTKEEYDWANDAVFAGALPPRRRILLTDTIGLGDRAFTFPRFDGKITLNMGLAGFVDPRRVPGGDYGNVFIHELVHACQFSRAMTRVGPLGNAIVSQIGYSIGASPYLYGRAGFDYAGLNLEAQAQVVSDWFSGRIGDGSNQTGKAKDAGSPYFGYIVDNVRKGQYSR